MNVSFPVVIEFALGLMLVYYITSLIVSSVTGWFLELLDFRARDLEQGLRELLRQGFDDATLAADSEGAIDTAVELLFERLYKDAQVKSLKPMYSSLLGKIGQVLAGVPLLKRLIGNSQHSVGEIPTKNFSQALSAVLTWVENMPDSENEVRDLVKDSFFIKQIDEQVKSSVETAETWFNGKMKEVSRLYEVHAKRIAALTALVVVVGLNLDSIAIGVHLWRQPSLRVSQQLASLDDLQDQSREELETALMELNIPMLWVWDPNLKTRSWLQQNELTNAGQLFSKAGGLILSWWAVSLGAPFWYQIIKRVRSSETTTNQQGFRHVVTTVPSAEYGRSFTASLLLLYPVQSDTILWRSDHIIHLTTTQVFYDRQLF